MEKQNPLSANKNILQNEFYVFWKVKPKGVAEASQIFHRDAHVLPEWLSYEEFCRRGRW
jgi:hypothetical protein